MTGVNMGRRKNESAIELLDLFSVFWKFSLIVAAILWVVTLAVLFKVNDFIAETIQNHSILAPIKFMIYAHYLWVLIPAMFAAMLTFLGFDGWNKKNKFGRHWD